MIRAALIGLLTLLVANLYLSFFANLSNFTVASIGLHLAGGFLAAMLIYAYYHSEFSKLSQSRRALVVIAMTMAIGVVWEFAEFIASQTLPGPIYDSFRYRVYFMGDLNDTMQDLLMDTLGGIAFLLLRPIFRSNSRQRFNTQEGQPPLEDTGSAGDQP